MATPKKRKRKPAPPWFIKSIPKAAGGGFVVTNSREQKTHGKPYATRATAVKHRDALNKAWRK